MIIKLYGSPGCARCNMICNILKSKNIKYEYKCLNVNDKDDVEIIKQAEKNLIKNFPIITVNSEYKTYQELLQLIERESL